MLVGFIASWRKVVCAGFFAVLHIRSSDRARSSASLPFVDGWIVSTAYLIASVTFVLNVAASLRRFAKSASPVLQRLFPCWASQALTSPPLPPFLASSEKNFCFSASVHKWRWRAR